MISQEQQQRALVEFTDAASKACAAARVAERDHEDYLYPRGPHRFDPAVKAAKLSAFNEADYLAESRAWIANLIRAAMDPQVVQRITELRRALQVLVDNVQDYETWQRPCHAFDVAKMALSKADTPLDSLQCERDVIQGLVDLCESLMADQRRGMASAVTDEEFKAHVQRRLFAMSGYMRGAEWLTLHPDRRPLRELEAIAANNSTDPVLANFEHGVRDGLANADAIAAKLEEADHVCTGKPPF